MADGAGAARAEVDAAFLAGLGLELGVGLDARGLAGHDDQGRGAQRGDVGEARDRVVGQLVEQEGAQRDGRGVRQHQGVAVGRRPSTRPRRRWCRRRPACCPPPPAGPASWSAARPSTRASTSLEPPGGKVTMILIGLSGQSAARAGRAAAAAPAARSWSARRRVGREEWVMASLCECCHGKSKDRAGRRRNRRAAEVGLGQRRVGGDLRRRAAGDDAAALDDIGAVGERQRQPRHLVHQQQRHAVAAQAVERSEEFGDDLGRQPQRGFVEQQQPRAATSARARSPASAARRPTAARRAGAAARAAAESAAACSSTRASRSCGCRKAPRRMLSSTLSSGNTWRPSGTSTRPSATICSAPQAGRGRGRRRWMPPGTRPVQPRQRAHQRRLAGAVGAQQRDHLAAAAPAGRCRAAPARRHSRRPARRRRAIRSWPRRVSSARGAAAVLAVAEVGAPHRRVGLHLRPACRWPGAGRRRAPRPGR